MKRFTSIIIVIFIIFAFGCSKDKDMPSDKYIELPYNIQNAYANNNIIDIQNGNKSYNVEKLEEFIDGKVNKVRIVSYHTGMDGKFDWNNPEQIYDLSRDGKEIILTKYSTKGVPSNAKIMKSGSDIFTTIGKNITNQDIQYIVAREKKGVMILSLVKNGFIDNSTREYLDSILNKK